ncbi:MAG: SanA/YdcF family protein [Candidatus Saccharibacteria bacterium]
MQHGITVVIALAVLGMIVMAPIVYTNISTSGRRYGASGIAGHTIPGRHIAIVFGAGVLPNGTPTNYLKDRINTAVALYKAGTVQKVLMTGDNSTSHHNEPVAMQRYAVEQGVPATDIVLDYAGFNTYDSCYRAHAIFGVNSAILVSHAYHLPRAITACRSLGVDSIGVAAQTTSSFSRNYLLREIVSTDKLMFQMLFKPRPRLLGPRITIP